MILINLVIESTTSPHFYTSRENKLDIIEYEESRFNPWKNEKTLNEFATGTHNYGHEFTIRDRMSYLISGKIPRCVNYKKNLENLSFTCYIQSLL